MHNLQIVQLHNDNTDVNSYYNVKTPLNAADNAIRQYNQKKCMRLHLERGKLCLFPVL